MNANKGEAASGTQALSSRGTQPDPDVIRVIKKGVEPTGYRYVGPEEAAKISETGYVPNVDAAGNPKQVYYGVDSGVTLASQAQKMYNIPYTPTHRVDLDTTGVTNIYGGNGQGIEGIEMITNDKIPAVDIQPLDK